MVTDMDWHMTFYGENTRDQAGQRKGWTGFTWDKHLFPDPKGFLDWSVQHSYSCYSVMNLCNIGVRDTV